VEIEMSRVGVLDEIMEGLDLEEEEGDWERLRTLFWVSRRWIDG
jgi:hypothetical protein